MRCGLLLTEPSYEPVASRLSSNGEKSKSDTKSVKKKTNSQTETIINEGFAIAMSIDVAGRTRAKDFQVGADNSFFFGSNIFCSNRHRTLIIRTMHP